MAVKFLTLLALFLLTGCLEETHDVSYYRANEDDRVNKIAECDNNPGEGQYKPNCVNARYAQEQINNEKPAKMPNLRSIYQRQKDE